MLVFYNQRAKAGRWLLSLCEWLCTAPSLRAGIADGLWVKLACYRHLDYKTGASELIFSSSTSIRNRKVFPVLENGCFLSGKVHKRILSTFQRDPFWYVILGTVWLWPVNMKFNICKQLASCWINTGLLPITHLKHQYITSWSLIFPWVEISGILRGLLSLGCSCSAPCAYTSAVPLQAAAASVPCVMCAWVSAHARKSAPPSPFVIQLAVSLQAPTIPAHSPLIFWEPSREVGIHQMVRCIQGFLCSWRQSSPLWALCSFSWNSGAQPQPRARTALWPLVLLWLLIHAIHHVRIAQVRAWVVCHPPFSGLLTPISETYFPLFLVLGRLFIEVSNSCSLYTFSLTCQLSQCWTAAPFTPFWC